MSLRKKCTRKWIMDEEDLKKDVKKAVQRGFSEPKRFRLIRVLFVILILLALLIGSYYFYIYLKYGQLTYTKMFSVCAPSQGLTCINSSVTMDSITVILHNAYGYSIKLTNITFNGCTLQLNKMLSPQDDAVVVVPCELTHSQKSDLVINYIRQDTGLRHEQRILFKVYLPK